MYLALGGVYLLLSAARSSNTTLEEGQAIATPSYTVLIGALTLYGH